MNEMTKSYAINRIAELEQENAELKAENERLKSENETYDREQYYYYNLSEDYKQTLQEIKKICKMDCGECQYNQDCDCNFEECEEAKIDDILALITKAEVGE